MSETDTRPVSQPVLDGYYEHVVTLYEYLGYVLPHELADHVLQRAIDKPSYIELLTQAQIALPAALTSLARVNFEHTSDDTLQAVVRRAQRDMLLADARATNVLCAGYQLRNGNPHSYISNTSSTALEESPDWKLLLKRCGRRCLLHLLKNTSVFLPLPNECLRQICGQPIYDRKPLARNAVKRKHEMTLEVCANKRAKPQRSSSSDIVLERSRIYYSKVKKDSCGLGDLHILSVLSQKNSEAASNGPDYADARHLSKHIWPKQYKLNHLKVRNRRKCDSIEAAIAKQGKVGTPQRLRAVLSILQEAIAIHTSFDYGKIISKHCPSTLRKKSLTKEEKTLLYQVISEDSQEPLTQAATLVTQRTSSSGYPVSPSTSFLAENKSQQARRNAKQPEKPRFAEFTISHHSVALFVQQCVERVLPRGLLGCNENWKRLNKNINCFISLRRYETLSLHQLTQGIKTATIPWLSRKGARATPSESDRRLEILQELLYWLFDGYIVELLRANFYITESAALLRQSLYFLQSDWQTICQPLLDHMSSNMFQKLEKGEAEMTLLAPSRRLAFSHVRLLPKERGVRPIVNLSRKQLLQGSNSLSINQVLQNTFAILTQEKDQHLHRVGSAVQAFNDIYGKMKAYKHTIISGSQAAPRFYFVKVDIRTCFDSIQQDKLLAILEAILTEDEYYVNRYVSIVRSRERTITKFAREARAADDFLDFPEFSFELADALRRTIFVDQVRRHKERRADVVKLLKEHVQDNIVKIGSSYYKQTVGIPQGSVLSTLLCNFFYGDMEKKHLPFVDEPQNLLLRLVDDFLFITTSKDTATRFLRTMTAGHPSYGCFISPEKTLVNFDVLLDSAIPVRKIGFESVGFPWCGLLIDQSRLEVRYDYSRLQGAHLGNSLTVRTHKQPGQAFANAMTHAIQVRCHLVYLDPTFNSLKTVYLNMYQAYQLVAKRYHSYIRIWGAIVLRNTSFFLNVIHRIVQHGWRTLSQLFGSKAARRSEASSEGIRKRCVLFLGYRAFQTVLQRKPTRYRTVLAHLRQICAFQDEQKVGGKSTTREEYKRAWRGGKGAKKLSQRLRPVLLHHSNAELDLIPF